MTSIEDWLGELGLERYAAHFAEAEVEFADLPDLTDEDLKEIGLPVGPRRKVSSAIKIFHAGLSTIPANHGSGAVSAAAEGASTSMASSSPERRHLTVMFVDLVGSTEMAANADAEDVREVITRFQNNVAGMIARYEGFVARFMGDGVLCYFGWPRANEDDAERSVRAGLAIIDNVRESSAPDGSRLACRIGIASGVVIVGDLIGSGASEEAAVVGQTPNLAARLQGLAQANQLVLPRETRSLLGNVFELQSLGAHELKGIEQPVEAYAVIGEAERESRFDARQQGKLSPIVGREQELELMREYWNRARSGAGQMVILSGEAGIGKSRMTRAIIDEIAQQEHIRIVCQCSPYHTDSAFYPVIRQIAQAAGFQSSDSAEIRLDRLESLDGVDADNIGLLAALLGIDASGRYPALELTPAQQRAHTMTALTQMLIDQSREKPLLLVFEDLHWIDPTSLELLDITLDAISDHAVLILGTARPTFEHGFGGHPRATRFALNRLGQEQIQSIVERLTDGRELPAEVLDIIARRTDGVPLFVEELTKTILDSGVLRADGDKLVLDGPLDVLAIPGTLHDSLMARLDRLQPIKEVAQIAACIGREFNYRLLASLSPLSVSELDSALEGLIDAELVYRRGVAPEAIYLFKHALVRDAAYESLLKEQRRSIHASILNCLETGNTAAPEVLARHAQAAGLGARAIDLWEQASQAAIARPAYDEAIAHLSRATELMAPLVANGEQAVIERALDLQIRLGTALLARRGYGDDAPQAAFEKALPMVDKIGDTPMRFSVLYGLWVVKYARAEHADALEYARTVLRIAEAASDTTALIVALRMIGASLTVQGRYNDARPHFERALSLFDPALHQGLGNRFGQELAVAVHGLFSISLWLAGETRQSKTQAQAAESSALALNHVNSICFMHLHVALTALFEKDEVQVKHHQAALASLAAEYNLRQWRDFAKVLGALINIGKHGEPGVAEYLQSDEDYVGSRSRIFTTYFRIEAGFRTLALGRVNEARALAAMARDLIYETGEAFALAELYRLEGALAAATGDDRGAESRFDEALEVARKQGSKSWELRAAIDLACLWQATGRGRDVRSLLQPIYDDIAEGDCPQDRVTARRMLEEQV